VHFPDGRNGYAVGNSGLISATRDGGETWTPLSHAVMNHDLNGVVFTAPDTGFAVGTDGRILRTVDGGETWGDAASGTFRDLHVAHFPDPRTGYPEIHGWRAAMGLPDRPASRLPGYDHHGRFQRHQLPARRGYRLCGGLEREDRQDPGRRGILGRAE
jgi:hypothetical protein